MKQLINKQRQKLVKLSDFDLQMLFPDQTKINIIINDYYKKLKKINLQFYKKQKQPPQRIVEEQYNLLKLKQLQKLKTK